MSGLEGNSNPNAKKDLKTVIDELIARSSATKQDRIKGTKKALIQQSTSPKPTTTIPSSAGIGWTERALVLHVYLTECEHCGASFSSPSHSPFILRYHPKKGLHHLMLNQHFNRLVYNSLPRYVVQVPVQVRMCQHCFEPTEFAQEMLSQTELDLVGGKSVEGDDYVPDYIKREQAIEAGIPPELRHLIE